MSPLNFSKKFFFAILFTLVIIVCSERSIAQHKEIIGYYPSWKSSSPNAMTPEKIPYKKFTMINYAFFYPLDDGTVIGIDTSGDDRNLHGERDTVRGGYKTGTALVPLAHANSVKVMISIGGWSNSDNFPEVARNEKTQVHFAHSCMDLIRNYGFDGIDIDWEFPCLTDHKGTPEDKINYTKLLQVLRDSLDEIGKNNGRRYLLTAAFPAQASGMKNFEIKKVSRILDMLNIMTYDLNGEWDSVSGHNAPLYGQSDADTVPSVDAAFRVLTKNYHVPASKINLGVPFYGHTYSNCVGLNKPHTGIDTVHFSSRGCFYYDVVANLDKFTRKWDDRAKVPYLVSTKWNTLISYDDEESVGYKARYAVDHQACGLIVWEITGDRLPDGTTPLLDVIYSIFNP